MDLIIYLVILSTVITSVHNKDSVFDYDLYEDVLDSVQCEQQLKIIGNNTMLLSEFLDAGPRTPRGILKGNLLDMGNYHQCLGINSHVENNNIEGKYCSISLPFDQEINWPDWDNIEWPEIVFPKNMMSKITRSRLDEEKNKQLKKHATLKKQVQTLVGVSKLNKIGRSLDNMPDDQVLRLAVCIPKPCSTKRTLNNLIKGFEDIGLTYTENYCRLPNDKKWVAGDYTAVAIFSIIGFLTIVSTSYDIRQTVILKKDPKSVSKLYQSFSVFTNTRRLLTFTPVPGALDCLDGIRALAMMWVILGHTFSIQFFGNIANPLDAYSWMLSYKAIWITSATITVDTFFMLSGLLVVYTTAGKVSRSNFFKNLHLIYLNRLLRLFPVLAAAILLQVSVFNQVSDGPNWQIVADQTHNCRLYWWSTLLYIQNFYKPDYLCIHHSWYLAIDFHLFLLSPLILYWVLGGRRRAAWIALTTGLLASLTASSIYNFMMNFPSATISLARPQDQIKYQQLYYMNTLTRSSPFFVGMIFGYMLHLYKGKKLVISKVQAGILWVIAFGFIISIIVLTQPIMQYDWDNQLADNFINSFQRPIWALSLGWIVFACAKGYGGPINWILSLSMWKLLSRLSYAMYILHYPLMYVVTATALAPIYFTVEFSFHRFAIDFTIAVLASFVITVLVDSPCSTLVKIFMGPGAKRPPPVKQPEKQPDNKQDIDIIINPTTEGTSKTAS